MTMDATTLIDGVTPGKGTGKEPPMSWSWDNPDAGYMLSTLTDPWLLYPPAAARKRIENAVSEIADCIVSKRQRAIEKTSTEDLE